MAPGLVKGTRIWFLVRHWERKLRRKFRLTELRGFREKTVDTDRFACRCQRPPAPPSELTVTDLELLKFIRVAQLRGIT